MTLQNIANGNVNSHNNMHMAVLNPVIERNIPVLKDILMELASVEDLIPQRVIH